MLHLRYKRLLRHRGRHSLSHHWRAITLKVHLRRHSHKLSRLLRPRSSKRWGHGELLFLPQLMLPMCKRALLCILTCACNGVIPRPYLSRSSCRWRFCSSASIVAGQRDLWNGLQQAKELVKRYLPWRATLAGRAQTGKAGL